MKSIKKLIATVLIAVSTLSFAGCSVIEKTPEAKNKQEVAKGDGITITREDVDKYLQDAGYIGQLQSTYGENYESNSEAKTQLESYRKSALDNLLNTELLKKYAEEKKLVPKEEDLNKQVDEKYNETKSQYDSDDAFKSAMEQAGYTEKSYKAEIKSYLIAQFASDDIIKGLKAEEYKDSHFKEKDFRKDNKDANLIQYIVINDDDKATEAKQKLDSGEAFADVAKEYNEDSSKDNGGYMGAVTKDDALDSEFLNKALALKEGETSEIFKGASDGSYASYSFIVKRISLDEAIPFAKVADKTSFESSAQSTLQKKQSDAINKKVEELKEEYNVKTYENKLNN